MRDFMVLTLLTTIASLCGCLKDAPSAATNTSVVPNEVSSLSPDNGSPSTEKDAPDFDPKLTLEWPGTPEESRRRINAGLADETTIYSATFSQTDPVAMFEASVYLISEEDLHDSNPKEMLASHGTSDTDEELSRRQVEHGPNKYPGFDVTAKSGDSFVRRLVVAVGRRIYTISVLSTKHERLNAEDVTRFFESFSVEE